MEHKLITRDAVFTNRRLPARKPTVAKRTDWTVYLLTVTLACEVAFLLGATIFAAH